MMFPFNDGLVVTWPLVANAAQKYRLFQTYSQANMYPTMYDITFLTYFKYHFNRVKKCIIISKDGNFFGQVCTLWPRSYYSSSLDFFCYLDCEE